jgi:hypothetical protein
MPKNMEVLIGPCQKLNYTRGLPTFGAADAGSKSFVPYRSGQGPVMRTMPLTRSFKEFVKSRIERDPEFRHASPGDMRHTRIETPQPAFANPAGTSGLPLRRCDDEPIEFLGYPDLA